MLELVSIEIAYMIWFVLTILMVQTSCWWQRGYLAPEYAITGQLTRKSDVYSFGVLILQIVSGRSIVDFDMELGEHYLVEKVWSYIW